jgi:hypothetical protein
MISNGVTSVRLPASNANGFFHLAMPANGAPGGG